MDNNKDPKFWRLVVKIFFGAVALIAFFGLGLYYTAKYNTYAPEGPPPNSSWGISTDSPIRSHR